jgi:membrane-associated phospholipid phosphatase
MLATRTRWWWELLTIAWLCWVYDAVTNLAPLRLSVALAHGRDILSAEQTLGIDPERTLDRWLAGHHTLGVILSYYYDNAHFIVTLGLLGFMWWSRADIFREMRNALVLINLLAFVVFWFYPVAPPRMLAGFTDVVASTHTLGSWHTGALASDANQLAAMPSLHIAWAMWSSLAAWRLLRSRIVAVIAACYPLLTAVTVLSTGNHYVLDVLAGAATMVLAGVLEVVVHRVRRRLRLGQRVPVTLAAAARCGMRTRRAAPLRPSASQSAGADAGVQTTSGPT